MNLSGKRFTTIWFLAVTFLFSAPLLSYAQVPNAWINEIHYDMAGTDTGEFVEVVIEDVGSWDPASLIVTRYNGSTGLVYTTPLLSEPVAEGATIQGFTFYTYTYLSNGLQNGDPDGVALSYMVPGSPPTEVLIQFLSYDGSFTGVGGIADGILSTDIGVGELSTTLVSQSLQLKDSGAKSQYGDYVWEGPIANTKGTINTNQTLLPFLPVSIVISEIMYDVGGVVGLDEEWVELYNTTTNTIDVSGWALYDDTGYVQVPATTTINAGEYLVLLTKTGAGYSGLSGISNKVVCTNSGSFSLDDAGDKLALYNGILPAATLIDGSPNVGFPDLSPSMGTSIERIYPDWQWIGDSHAWAPSANYVDIGSLIYCTPGVLNWATTTGSNLSVSAYQTDGEFGVQVGVGYRDWYVNLSVFNANSGNPIYDVTAITNNAVSTSWVNYTQDNEVRFSDPDVPLAEGAATWSYEFGNLFDPYVIFRIADAYWIPGSTFQVYFLTGFSPIASGGKNAAEPFRVPMNLQAPPVITLNKTHLTPKPGMHAKPLILVVPNTETPHQPRKLIM